MAERSLQQLLVTNFALNPSGYTGSRGDTGYVGSAGSGASVPKITAISYPGDDTAANTAGGDTITITGTGFASGASVIINGTVASVVSVVNSTTITFTAPAVTAGSYILYVVNTDGSTALAVPGIQYSGTPAWTTSAGTLGTAVKETSFTANLTATGDAPITYSVYSGSLPSGISLTANTGVLSGTLPNVSVDTTYNFTIRSTDAQMQDTDRAFSITVVPTNPPPTVEYLIVAGGGGAYGVGAGGAGGLLSGSSLSVSPFTAYTVTVGAGGIQNANGDNSAFNSLTAIGGGSGGWTTGPSVDAYGRNGGSGGGASYGSPYSTQTVPGGTGTAGQGRNGGSGTLWAGGGGGGAGAPGGNATGSQSSAGGGAGGAGLSSAITGTSTVYAGGGGGGCYVGGSGGPGAGGSGGGGAGASASSNESGTSGTANTGGGGGGGFGPSNGGSGIVVIRYADNYSQASYTTGSPTITTAGGYRIYKFTSSGSITF